jgi:hypothetical protein
VTSPALGVTTLVLCFSLLGCGGAEHQREGGASSSPTGSTCAPAGEVGGRQLSLRYEPNRQDHGTFLVEDATGTTVLPVGEPAHDGPLVGHWRWAAVSPDGSTLLAQWSAECEVPIAFFVSAAGGLPRAVTGERDWTTAPSSVALGWTTDGRAIVFLPAQSCGQTFDPGVYLVDPDGGMILARPATELPPSLEPSLEPRPATAVGAH